MRAAIPAILIVFGTLSQAHADIPLDGNEKLFLQGQFTFRAEADWDSEDAAGVKRDDRNRARMRARLGLRYEATEHLGFGVRFRSGDETSQQSQFVSVLDSDDDAVAGSDLIWDKWYATARAGGAWTTVGRNSAPFWTQNESFWDNDVTIAGVSGGYRFKRGLHRVDLMSGYFTLPDGAVRLGGNLAAGQVVHAIDDEWWSMTTALGIFIFNGSDSTVNLLHGNGARDYRILVGGAQLKLPTGHRPITLGVDFMHNGERYSDNDPDAYAAANRRRRDGYVLSVQYGWLKKPRDWLISYYHARIETLAVHTSYAQDDWARWGSATQGDLSDLEGHEFRGTMNLGRNLTMMARYCFVQAITSPQDGKRFRLDFTFEI